MEKGVHVQTLFFLEKPCKSLHVFISYDFYVIMHTLIIVLRAVPARPQNSKSQPWKIMRWKFFGRNIRGDEKSSGDFIKKTPLNSSLNWTQRIWSNMFRSNHLKYSYILNTRACPSGYFLVTNILSFFVNTNPYLTLIENSKNPLPKPHSYANAVLFVVLGTRNN